MDRSSHSPMHRDIDNYPGLRRCAHAADPTHTYAIRPCLIWCSHWLHKRRPSLDWSRPNTTPVG
eukprot:3166538-Alexandrium_andersonii.AAC.1